MNIIAVRFKNLVKELSLLCNLDIKNDVIGYHIATNACFYGNYDLNNMINIINSNDNMYLYVILYGKKNNKYIFFYNLEFRLNLDELEYDGSRLIDNCYVKYGNNNLHCLNYCILCINNIDNLNLYFDDSFFNKCNDRDFYPVDLLKKAVNNCFKNKTKVKKRSIFD